ncbi:MAG: translation initiation factor IF-2 [Flavobacteriaceae bacterium]|nr:translation initiation factor IF-2 [Flavobacteriaceae bacterium]
MSGQIYQLLKVVKEFNVGVQSIADYLSSNGHKVDAKPTAKLTEEQYQMVAEKFGSEKNIKAEATSLKAEKPKNSEITAEQVAKVRTPKMLDEDDQVIIKNALATRTEKVVKKTVKPEEIVVVPEPPATIAEMPDPIIKAKKKETIEASDNEDSKVKVSLTVAGKIDLADVPDDPLRPDKKAKAKKKSEEANAVENAKKDGKKKSEPTKDEPIATVPKEEAKSVKGKKAAKAVEQPPAAAVEPTTPVESEERKVMATNFQKIEGFKVMGKIVLPVEPPPSDRGGKRKRKKVGGEKIAIPKDDKVTRSSDRERPQRPGQPARGGAREPRTEISDKQVQDKLKETLARLNPGGGKKNIGDVRGKLRRQKRDDMAGRREEAHAEEQLQSKVLKVTEFLSANELAQMMNLNVTQIIQACFSLGMMVSINQRLDAETIIILAEEFGYTVEFVSADTQESIEEEIDLPEDLKPRPPIVTVMGHVDHGKTSLLDYVRAANVVAGEAGGITQHIGAYEVTLANGKHVTFLDTPGHEAFTAMRARGAKITDIVIVVISADDSVMPQTKEAISHAQAAGVPIVFAINKIDKDGANPDRIREQLSAMNILVEEWGGKFQCQEISAKKGLNIDLLLEKVLLEAELLDLKANPNKRAVGSVIEATLDKGRGNVCTVMIQAGTLKIGSPILAGTFAGKVKAMFNERGVKVTKVGPSTPVTVLGLPGAPQAGDKFIATETEQEAKEIANRRTQLMREQGLRTHRHITLDEIGRRLAIGNFKELNLIVKGDVDGSVEALADSLLKLSTEEIQVNVIYKAVGQISESDINLASASDAIIIGFNVRPSVQARRLAELEDIDIRLYNIIYDAINEVKAAMEGMLAPSLEEKITCTVEIREVFKIQKVGTIAGCMVMDGRIARNTKIRVVRDGVVVHTGDLSSLKRFKDDVKEVAAGFDCGLSINNFNDIQERDVIEGYEQVEIKRKLA